MFLACGLYFNKHKRMRPRDQWGDHNGHTHDDKRPKLEADAVRSSPRLNRSTSDHNESPRKRARLSKISHPSPRMATRASAKTQTNGSGPSTAKTLDFSEGMFSPTSIYGTSPATGNGNALGAGLGDGEVDIESLLAQFANDQPGFNLDALFASVNAGNGEGDGGQGMVDLLSAWEDAAQSASGSAVQNKEGTG